MKHRSKLHHGLRDWNLKKRARWSEINEKPQCSIPTCYQGANSTTPSGVKLCNNHYANWLENNPPDGKPIERVNMTMPYTGFSYEDMNPGYDEYPEDNDNSLERLFADGDDWKQYNRDACPTCGEFLDEVYGIQAIEPFMATNPDAGINVWGPADVKKVIVCQGQSEDYTCPHVHIRFMNGQERLVFLEGKHE